MRLTDRLVLSISFCIIVCLSVSAQSSTAPKPAGSNQQKMNEPSSSTSAEKGSPNEDGPPMTTFEEEMRAKRAIKLAEKEHEENLNRAKEISQLGRELQDLAKKNPTSLDREGLKKIDRLEKLTKKIRGEAGGDDDHEISIPNRPSDLTSAVTRMTEVADSLAKSVQNTPRQVVSASVIDNANVLLELIKLTRTLTR